MYTHMSTYIAYLILHVFIDKFSLSSRSGHIGSVLIVLVCSCVQRALSNANSLF